MPTEVTTVIPVYNGANYLRYTLDSLAKQTRPQDRVIVINDCSTDNTCDIVRSYRPIQCDLISLFPIPTLNGSMRTAGRLKKLPPPPHMLFTQMPRKKLLIQQCELNTIACGSLVLKTNYQTIPLRFRSNYQHVADVIFYAELASIAPTIWKTKRRLSQIRQHNDNATASNKKNIQSWVIDEWHAMKLISERIPENTVSRTIQRQKLKCMFAARSLVKQQDVGALDPKYADQIETEVRKHISPLHFAMGQLAVKLYRPTNPSKNESAS